MKPHTFLRRVPMVLGLLALCLGTGSVQASSRFMGWHWEPIAPGAYLSLAVDAAGQGHVAYYDPAAHNLKYAVRGESGWQVTTADGGDYVGLHPSLGLDSDGAAHISHVSGAIHRLYYTFQDAAGWQTEIVVDGVPFAEAPLAIDDQGRIHLVYQVGDGLTSHIIHAIREEGAWRGETLFSCPVGPYQGCGNIDMVLDSRDHPHVAFTLGDGAGWRLMVAARSDDAWTVEPAGDALGAAGVQELSLGVDALFRPHISHSNFQGLRYTFRDAAGWHTEVVGSRPGLWNDLAVTAGGVPHLAYYDRQGMTLHYAYRDAGGWHDLTLDNSDWVGHFPDLVLVGGYPVIAYVDPSDFGPQLLRYAYLTPLDIWPGDYPNLIDPLDGGKIMVVVLGTAELDVQTLDLSTARLGPAGAAPIGGRAFYKDGDQDGDLDLVLTFRTAETGIPCGATTAVLQAETVTGAPFVGWDDITTVGCSE